MARRETRLQSRQRYSDMSDALSTSGCLSSFSSQTNFGNLPEDNARITMKTRVAVRDKNPHRFQVVPLRDASRNLTFAGSDRISSRSITKNFLRTLSPSRERGSYAESKLTCSSSTQTLFANSSSDKETLTHCAGSELNIHRTLAESESLARAASFALSRRELTSGPVLSQRDLNRERGQSIPGEYDITTCNASLVSCINPRNATTTNSIHNTGFSTFKPKQPSKHTTLPALLHTSVSKQHAQNFDLSGKDLRAPESESFSVPKDVTDLSKLKRRHAIYSQTIYAPYYEHYLCTQDTLNSKSSQTLLDKNGSLTEKSFSGIDQKSEFLDDQDITLVYSGLPESLSLSPKPVDRALPFIHPLSIRKPSLGKPLTLGWDDFSKPVVYSPIVLDLLADIEASLEEWTEPFTFP